MTTDHPLRSFDTPNLAHVDHVAIYPHDGDHAFRATQFYERDGPPLGGGDATWYDEREEYVLTDEYRTAVAEHTHIPAEDIRLESLPIAHGVI